jgi:hypothetical protein
MTAARKVIGSASGPATSRPPADRRRALQACSDMNPPRTARAGRAVGCPNGIGPPEGYRAGWRAPRRAGPDRPCYLLSSSGRRGGVSYATSVARFFSACSASRSQAALISSKILLVAPSDSCRATPMHRAALCRYATGDILLPAQDPTNPTRPCGLWFPRGQKENPAPFEAVRALRGELAPLARQRWAVMPARFATYSTIT